MKVALAKLAALVAALAVLGFLVAASGIVPVKASSGHWPPTRWFLSFSMERSVSTWSLGNEPPALDDPAMVLRGAGHYEIGCRPCHGAPGAGRSEIARELTPEPPLLAGVVRQWEPGELFQLVKHGIKMTGMPAWPARERDDEVWAVVAFLVALPELSPEAYRELAFGDAPPAGADERAAVPDEVAATLERSCARCHGADGLGRGSGAFPVLAGQEAPYLAASLRAYRLGLRHSGIMEPLASALDDATIARMAERYAGMSGSLAAADSASASRSTASATAPSTVAPSRSAAPPPDAGSLARGEAIARRGIPRRKVPACVHCHGPVDRPLDPRFPALAGQPADYLALQLRLFAGDRRGGTDYAHVMSVVVRGLQPEEMRDVAAWYASLGRPTAPPGR